MDFLVIGLLIAVVILAIELREDRKQIAEIERKTAELRQARDNLVVSRTRAERLWEGLEEWLARHPEAVDQAPEECRRLAHQEHMDTAPDEELAAHTSSEPQSVASIADKYIARDGTPGTLFTQGRVQ